MRLSASDNGSVFLFSLLLFSMRFSLVKLNIFYLSQVRLPGVIDGSGR